VCGHFVCGHFVCASQMIRFHINHTLQKQHISTQKSSNMMDLY